MLIVVAAVVVVAVVVAVVLVQSGEVFGLLTLSRPPAATLRKTFK